MHAFNGVAALKYEGADVSGRIVLANRDTQTPAPAPDFLFRFSEPVHLSKTRWARKLLQLGSDPASLIANVNAIYGVITNPDVVAMETDRTFSVTFPADRQWTISYRSQPLLCGSLIDVFDRMPDPSIDQALDLVVRRLGALFLGGQGSWSGGQGCFGR